MLSSQFKQVLFEDHNKEKYFIKKFNTGSLAFNTVLKEFFLVYVLSF